MADLREKKAIASFTLDMDGEEYVMQGGGGTPGPGTVGTEQLIDDSVEMEDLNHKVKDKMLTDDDRVTQEDLDNFNL